jgi:hypothetical protein
VPCSPRVPSPDVFEHRPVVHAERFGMGRYPKTFTLSDKHYDGRGDLPPSELSKF